MAGNEKKKGSHEYKNEPGNQTPNTPDKKESERGKGHEQSQNRKHER